MGGHYFAYIRSFEDKIIEIVRPVTTMKISSAIIRVAIEGIIRWKLKIKIVKNARNIHFFEVMI
jgi:hypothetical protein